ncbi:MAG: hypothetical protein ACRD1N_03885 [Terriglobia bacterium]
MNPSDRTSAIQRLFQHRLARLGATVLSGILLALVFPRVSVTGLVWFACIPLFLALAFERNIGFGFLWGLITGAVFLAASLSWFVAVMENYGGLASYEALAAMVLFLALFSPFWGVFGLLEVWAAQRSARLALLLAPFLWVALELARTYLITGFPWNLLGYGVQAQGLEQIASVTSVYGLSFFAAATSALLCWVLIKPRFNAARGFTIAWIVFLLVLDFALAPPPPKRGNELAVLVQPDAPLKESEVERWVPWRNPDPLEQLVNLSVRTVQQHEKRGAKPPLIVW